MRHSRTARAVFAILFFALYCAYMKLTTDTRMWSRDLESWGEAIEMHAVSYNESAGIDAFYAQQAEIAEAKPAETPEPDEPAETPEPEPEPEDNGLPKVDLNSWELMLVNADNSAGEYAPPELVDVEGQQVDSRIADALRAMGEDARAQGLSVYYSSAYRSYSEQAANFRRICENNGISDGKDAQGFYITMPAGCSEHQTGLCCDITDHYYQTKNRSIEETAMYQYMSQHCQEFGFIVRFPDGKEDVTGVMYEPWHFRYVGVEAATYIMENGLTLEEFIALYNE